MTARRLLLLHGVATTGAVWDRVRRAIGPLPGIEVLAPDRPATGDLDTESEWLAPLAEGSIVGGFSGGATLGLHLAASPVRLAGALLHEPAVGSLVPGLLAPVATAYERDGFAGFGEALYGPLWRTGMAAEGGASVARELPMFRAFEPAEALPGQGEVLVSVGALSPAPRQAASAALRDRLGYRSVTVPGSSHFVVEENPEAFAREIRALVARVNARG